MNDLEKNNAQEMSTIVETFLIEETVSLIYDNEKLEQWNRLVSDLGLKGQNQLSKPDKSPIPFLYLKNGMVNVFLTLCPLRVNIKEFNVTPIPLEILNLISLSEREQYFSNIQIWYDEKTPDPVCIGIIENWILHKKGTYETIKDTPSFNTKKDAENYALINNLEADAYHYNWNNNEKHYLIGKWADVKHPLSELKQMAIQKYTEQKGIDLRKKIKDMQRELDDIEQDAILFFN